MASLSGENKFFTASFGKNDKLYRLDEKDQSHSEKWRVFRYAFFPKQP